MPQEETNQDATNKENSAENPVIQLEPEQSTATPVAKFTTPHAIALAGLFIAVAIVLHPLLLNKNSIPNEAVAQASSASSIEEMADSYKLNEKVKECAVNGDTTARVLKDSNNAQALGGTGTPYMVILGPNNLEIPLSGAYPIEIMTQVIDAIKAGQSDKLGEVEKLKGTLDPITSTDHVRGNPNGTITIVEYSDLDCPFCSQFHTTMKKLVETYPDLRWVYRHFPLDSIHPNSRSKSMISECVGKVGGEDAFWSFVDQDFASKG